MKKKLSKWQKIIELQDLLKEYDENVSLILGDENNVDLEMLTFAPNIGERAWIFSYKGIYVLMWDMGNSYYEYCTAVSWLDMIRSKIGSAIVAHRVKKYMKKYGDA